MKFLPTRCKICKGACEVACEDDTPQDFVDKLIPAVTCNNCWDIKNRNDEAMDLIGSNCVLLCQYGDKPKPETILNSCRASLTVATQKLAKAIADFYHKPDDGLWSRDIVEALMEEPGKWYMTVSAFRRQVRRQVMREKQQNPPAAEARLPYAEA